MDEGKLEPLKGAIEEFLKHYPEMRECVHFKELIRRKDSAADWLKAMEFFVLEAFFEGHIVDAEAVTLIYYFTEEAFEVVMKC